MWRNRMNYLNKMYGRSKQQPALTQASDKNPNRVTGGLKGQGVDTFTMLGEDGNTKEIPTIAYVRSLEEQLKKKKIRFRTIINAQFKICDKAPPTINPLASIPAT